MKNWKEVRVFLFQFTQTLEFHEQNKHLDEVEVNMPASKWVEDTKVNENVTATKKKK